RAEGCSARTMHAETTGCGGAAHEQLLRPRECGTTCMTQDPESRPATDQRGSKTRLVTVRSVVATSKREVKQKNPKSCEKSVKGCRRPVRDSWEPPNGTRGWTRP